MPPLRKAMSFVDRDQRQADRLKRIQNIRLEKGLGRGIENIDLASPHILPECPPLFLGKIGVESFCPHTCLTQGGDLIDHQRDQGRNNQPHSLTGERRNLVTKRLPAPCWHQHKSIVACHHLPDDFRLLSTKRIVAIDGLENLQGVGDHVGFLMSWTVCASWPNQGLSQRKKAESVAERRAPIVDDADLYWFGGYLRYFPPPAANARGFWNIGCGGRI